MFPSLVQTQSLVLFALYGIALARDEHSLDDVSIDPVVPAIAGASVQDDAPKLLGRNATINLHSASPSPIRPMGDHGCSETAFNTISLATDTCLSGDYYLSLSMQITEAPVCPNGETPTLNSHGSRGCEGIPLSSTEKVGKVIPSWCLWGGVSPKYWSIIFRCSGSAASEGAVKHQVATPPPAPEPEAGTDGVVVGHLSPACNGRRVGGPTALDVPTDRCFVTPGFGIEIKKAAVCTNGTRAQWARFSDHKCGHGTISDTYGLVDLADSDIGTCLSTGKVGNQEKINSMAFWCDGVSQSALKDDEKEEKPDDKKKPQSGSVSESACMTGKAPFFNHPETDTCVNLKTSKMKIYSAGVCANGTQSMLALYKDNGCMSEPVEFKDIKEEDLKICMDLTGTSSFAFYCTGEDIATPPTNSPPNPGNNKESGGIMQFLLVLSLICLMFFLMLVLSIFAWVRKYGGSVGKLIDLVKGIFQRNEGAIAL